MKRALDENFRKLKVAIIEGKIDKETVDEYKKILKQTLSRNCKSGLFQPQKLEKNNCYGLGVIK
jgi:hypothetical protein